MGEARPPWLLASQGRSCVWSRVWSTAGELFPDHREGSRRHSGRLGRSGQSPSKEQTDGISRPWARSRRLARSQPGPHTSLPCRRVSGSAAPRTRSSPGLRFLASAAPSQSGSRSRTPQAFGLEPPNKDLPGQSIQEGRVQETHRPSPSGNRAWPTACFSFGSMGPEYCRHAQVSTVTPERKAPPQHVRTPVTLPQSQHLGKKEKKSRKSGWLLERAAIP